MFEAGSIIWRIQTIGKQVLKQDLAESEAAANKAAEALGKTAKGAEDTGKKSEQAVPKVKGLRQEIAELSDRAQAGYTKVGSSLLIVGAALVAVTGLTVKAATEWETAWTGVTKTIDAPAEQLERIESGLRGLTRELPASHREIAAVAEAAGQLGVAAEDVVDFTRTMIDLGETTNLTSDEAATSLAQLMNIFQTAPEDVDNLGSSIVALGNNGASTERDIVQMSQRIAGAAKIIGLSEGQTLGLANALASVGIEAEAGGSSVSNIMIDIANAVSSKGPKLIEWAKLAGLSADEFAEKYRTKPAEALALVIEGMGRLNDSGGDVFKTLTDLGQTDVRVTRSLLGLAGSGDMLRKSLQLGNDAWKDNTALQIEAAKRYDTTAAKLEMARNSITDTAIDMGEYLLPAVQAVSEGVATFSSFLGDLPAPVQGAALVLTVLAGVIALTSGAAISAVPRFLAFKTAVEDSGRSMKTIAFAGGAVGIAITALITIFGAVAVANSNAAAKAEAYGETLDKVTNKITAATRESAKAALSAKGTFLGLEVGADSAYDAATKIGLSLSTVTDAATGNADALQLVQDRLEEIQKMSSAERTSAFGDDGQLAEASAQRVVDAVKGENASINEAIRIAKQKQNADADSAESNEDLADSYDTVEEAVDGVVTSIQDLAKELDELNGKNLDAREAARQLESAYDDFDATLKENGKTLDVTTEAGRENQAALDAIAKAALESGQAIVDAGGGYEQYRASLESSRAALLDRINLLGITGQEAENLADAILQIPSEQEWKLYADTAAAEASLKRIRDLMNGIGATAQVHIANGRGSGGITQADGGKVNFYANGGRENHIAQFARAGTMRVWAEPETGGEWYIPAHPAKRQRSTDVLAAAADEFGYQLVPKGGRSFADGGRDGVAPVSSRAGTARIEGSLELVNGRAFITGIIHEELGSGY